MFLSDLKFRRCSNNGRRIRTHAIFPTLHSLSRIWGSQSGGYGKYHLLGYNAVWKLGPARTSWTYFSTLKMEVIYSFETSVETQRTTRRYIPEYSTLHNHRCENLKSYKVWALIALCIIASMVSCALLCSNWCLRLDFNSIWKWKQNNRRIVGRVVFSVALVVSTKVGD
jgi:hypothetical protein